MRSCDHAGGTAELGEVGCAGRGEALGSSRAGAACGVGSNHFGLRDVGRLCLVDELEPVREGQVALCDEVEDVSDHAAHIRAVGRVERLQCRLIERHDVPDDEAESRSGGAAEPGARGDVHERRPSGRR